MFRFEEPAYLYLLLLLLPLLVAFYLFLTIEGGKLFVNSGIRY